MLVQLLMSIGLGSMRIRIGSGQVVLGSPYVYESTGGICSATPCSSMSDTPVLHVDPKAVVPVNAIRKCRKSAYCETAGCLARDLHTKSR